MDTSKEVVKIAHISDLHFALPQIKDFVAFNSKRWLGTLNLAVNRKVHFCYKALCSLPELFKSLEVDVVCVTGDLSTTSRPEEFAAAQTYLKSFKEAGLRVFVIPGNHDHYTRAACRKKLFYDYFDTSFNEGATLSLKEDRLTLTRLNSNVWLIALDTALATSLLSSCGEFSPKLEQALEEALTTIPSDACVVLMNHFPIFEQQSIRKNLRRKEALKALLARFPQVKCYLHGHTHRHSIADLTGNSLPLVLDSGCAVHKENATWNLLKIAPHCASVTGYKSTASGTWEPFKEITTIW